MPSQTIESSSAARQRRYRQRQREGWRVVKLPVHDEYFRALVDQSFFAEGDADDRQKIAAAVDLLLFVLAAGAIEIDYDHFS